jgi:hypothetical protein
VFGTVLDAYGNLEVETTSREYVFGDLFSRGRKGRKAWDIVVIITITCINEFSGYQFDNTKVHIDNESRSTNLSV